MRGPVILKSDFVGEFKLMKMVLTAQKCFYFKTRKTKREHLDKWQIKNTTIRRDVMLSLGCLARSHWVFFIFFKEALVDEWAKMGVGVK
mgnify:CR=1 FL=1